MSYAESDSSDDDDDENYKNLSNEEMSLKIKTFRNLCLENVSLIIVNVF